MRQERLSIVNSMKNPQNIREMLEAHVQSQPWDQMKPKDLYAPMGYLLSLKAKRVRPVLLLLAYQAVSGNSPEKGLNAAAAVELFHNFTLMHDDIMDNAPVRRGQPTVHEKWNVDTAILSGDAMFTLAIDFLIRDNPEQAAPLVHEFTRVSLGVCEGQMNDMVMAESESASIDQYVEMIRQKTAMLIAGSMSIGAIAAGAKREVVDRMYALGEAAGIGFQLQDDYMDVYAEQAKFGKQVGGDILENKKTFLLLKALELANPTQRKELDRLLYEEQDPEAKIAGVKAIYAELDIPGLTQAKIESYFMEAARLAETLSHLKGFAYIREYLGFILNRDF